MPVQQNSTKVFKPLSQLDIQGQRRRPEEFSVLNQHSAVIWRPVQPAPTKKDSEVAAHSQQPLLSPETSTKNFKHQRVTCSAYSNAIMLDSLCPIRVQQEMDKKDKQQVAKTEICTLLEKTSIPTNSDQDHQQPPTSNISRLEQKAPKNSKEMSRKLRLQALRFPRHEESTLEESGEPCSATNLTVTNSMQIHSVEKEPTELTHNGPPAPVQQSSRQLTPSGPLTPVQRLTLELTRVFRRCLLITALRKWTNPPAPTECRIPKFRERELHKAETRRKKMERIGKCLSKMRGKLEQQLRIEETALQFGHDITITEQQKNVEDRKYSSILHILSETPEPTENPIKKKRVPAD
jgi:hypothetical protein